MRIYWSSMRTSCPGHNELTPILVRIKEKLNQPVWEYICGFYFKNDKYTNGAVFINSKIYDYIEFTKEYSRKSIIEYMELSQLEQEEVEEYLYGDVAASDSK